MRITWPFRLDNRLEVVLLLGILVLGLLALAPEGRPLGSLRFTLVSGGGLVSGRGLVVRAPLAAARQLRFSLVRGSGLVSGRGLVVNTGASASVFLLLYQ